METHNFKFEPGVEAKSIISGFKGIITSRACHLNGCDRYWLAPKCDKDGKMPEGYWFDEGELVLTASKKKIKPQNQERGGFHSSVK